MKSIQGSVKKDDIQATFNRITEFAFSSNYNNANLSEYYITKLENMQNRAKLHFDRIACINKLALLSQKFYLLLTRTENNILNSNNGDLLTTIINIHNNDLVKQYLQTSVTIEQKNKINNIISQIKDYTHQNNLKLKKILKMNVTFYEILENIRNVSNVDNQIKIFYDNLFGKSFQKLKVILEQGTNEELETIQKILSIDEVKNYLVNWISKGKHYDMKEMFENGIQGTMLEMNKKEDELTYQGYLLSDLLQITGFENINDVLWKLLDIQQDITFNNSESKQEIIKSIINIFTNTLQSQVSNDFKEILNHHNLRNILNKKY